MEDHSNKRRFIRMTLENLPMTLTLSNGTTLQAFCKNLSGMGMLIRSANALTIGDRVEALIKTPKSQLVADAVIMREQGEEQGEKLYGLAIKKIL